MRVSTAGLIMMRFFNSIQTGHKLQAGTGELLAICEAYIPPLSTCELGIHKSCYVTYVALRAFKVAQYGHCVVSIHHSPVELCTVTDHRGSAPYNWQQQKYVFLQFCVPRLPTKDIHHHRSPAYTCRYLHSQSAPGLDSWGSR